MKKWNQKGLCALAAGILLVMMNSHSYGLEKMIAVSQQAPEFTLPSTMGADFKLSEYLGRSNVVLFFYPKNNTNVCTAEACSFRDNYQAFKQAGAEVVGISSDSVASHEKFVARLHLPYILLSDAGGKVRKLYGVPATAKIIPGRATFLIDKKGIVRNVFNSQLDAQKHVDETIRILKTLP